METDVFGERSKSLPDFVYIAPGVKTYVSDWIRRRAYELFEERGRQSGHDVEDWLQAEQEMKQHWGNEEMTEPTW